MSHEKSKVQNLNGKDISLIIEFAIFVICLVLSSYQSYKIGVRNATEITLDKLRENKIITIDDKGNIVPNPFFDA